MSEFEPDPELPSESFDHRASEATNPFKPPVVNPLTGELDGEVIPATVVESRRALWPVFVVVVASIVTAIVVSGITLAAAAAASGDLHSLVRSPETRTTWMTEFVGSGFGLSVLVLPGQLVFAAFAMIAALFSRDRWVDRLGFRTGRLPAWSWLLFLAGTPIVGVLAAQLMSGVAEQPSEQLKMLEQMLQSDSLGSLLTLLLLVSLLPGIVEEILFRGYMQRRLLTRLPAAVSIIICSLFFAAAHMDVMHAVGVLPLGLWLGVIAWRADSIWPAMFGHIGNNGFAIVLTTIMGNDPQVAEANPIVVALMGASLFAFVASIVVLVIVRKLPQPAADPVQVA